MNYTILNKFLLRNPSLPFYSEDFLYLTPKNLIDFYKKNDFFKESIYVASKKFYHEVEKSISKGIFDENLIFSLAKYYIRLKTRCTPFGTFSSFSVGEVSSDNKFILDSYNKYEKNIRLDVEFLSQIINNLIWDKDIIQHLKFLPNNTIFDMGILSTYIESSSNEFSKQYFNSTFEKNTHISKILFFCKERKTINEISFFLNDLFSIKPEDSYEFIIELIENQILVSNLNISTIDSNPFRTLLCKLRHLQHLPKIKYLFNINQILLSNSKKVISIDQDINRISSKFNS